MRNRLYFWGFRHYPKLKYAISRCYIFPDGSVWLMDNLLCLCDVWKGPSYVKSNVSVSSIFNEGHFYIKSYFLHHRNPLPLPLREIQLSVNCYLSVVIFQQNAKTITVRYIHSTWRNVPRPSLKCSLLTSTDWRYRDVTSEHVF